MPERPEVLDHIVTDRKFLAQRSKETTYAEMKELHIVARLINMLDNGWTAGIGLAAIQIGVPIRCAVFIPNRVNLNWSKDPVTIVNPKILSFENLNMKSREGCLSVPDVRVNTYRYGKVTVAMGEDQTTTIVAEGTLAQVYQHEIDHMDGILCDARTIIQGRNERCGCGSGLKFKKCHGK